MYLVEEASEPRVTAKRDVEAHPGRRFEIGPEDVADPEDHALAARALRELLRIDDPRKSRPEKIAGARLDEDFHAGPAQQGERRASRLGDAGLGAPQIAGVVAIGQQAADELFGEQRCRDRRQHLDVGEAVDPLAARRDEADAQAADSALEKLRR